MPGDGEAWPQVGCGGGLCSWPSIMGSGSSLIGHRGPGLDSREPQAGGRQFPHRGTRWAGPAEAASGDDGSAWEGPGAPRPAAGAQRCGSQALASWPEDPCLAANANIAHGAGRGVPGGSGPRAGTIHPLFPGRPEPAGQEEMRGPPAGRPRRQGPADARAQQSCCRGPLRGGAGCPPESRTSSIHQGCEVGSSARGLEAPVHLPRPCPWPLLCPLFGRMGRAMA